MLHGGSISSYCIGSFETTDQLAIHQREAPGACITRTTLQYVVALTTFQPVVASAADNNIVTFITVESVITGTGAHNVVTCTATNNVIVLTKHNDLALAVAGYDLRAGTTDHGDFADYCNKLDVIQLNDCA